VLVGAPSRGFAAVVAGMLIGAAVVSARRQRPHALRPFLFACAVAILVPVVARAGIALPWVVRGALVLTIAAIAGVGVGGVFAFVLSTADRAARPWLWAVNGAASVLGSALAVILPVSFGLQATLFVAAALYGLGGWLAARDQ
ncbi:MAG: hypothetical protein IT381_08505, partial [Deltaproteobacteria bacterium]|nr:hypothetical protein [Deltaproteobacteria bacterium]